jgi:hypothetical protein
MVTKGGGNEGGAAFFFSQPRNVIATPKTMLPINLEQIEAKAGISIHQIIKYFSS